MKYLLLLLGPLVFPLNTSHEIERPQQEVKVFIFYHKNDCENAANALYKAREVQSAICIEISCIGN